MISAAALLVLLLAIQIGRTPESVWSGGALILATLGSLLAGINFSFAYTYMRLREKDIVQSENIGTLNLLRTGINIGGVVCGIALLSIVLGFLGFSTMLSGLTYQGQEIGYIGLIILLIATYTLSRKVTELNVC